MYYKVVWLKFVTALDIDTLTGYALFIYFLICMQYLAAPSVPSFLLYNIFLCQTRKRFPHQCFTNTILGFILRHYFFESFQSEVPQGLWFSTLELFTKKYKGWGTWPESLAQTHFSFRWTNVK